MSARLVPVAFLFAASALAAEPATAPLDPAAARTRTGQEVRVRMAVATAKDRLEKRGEIYLDSEADFKDPKNFAVVITNKGAAALKAAGIENPADHFDKKTIEAKGAVKEVDGVPRIEIDSPDQIALVKK